ncbi:MAG: glycosyltransferase [Acidobacteria bacterium]|nr:glycosyltransferase [Acidobacteriota bacterium]
MTTPTQDRPLRIAILHPDLGLGGAERLIVDAALELQQRGHRVTLFTSSHDRTRAFDETCDGTLDVRVHGAWLPVHVGGRLRAAAAIARMTVGAMAVLHDSDPPDLVLCDVVPHVIPVLRALRPRLPVLFYCHFPDQLLTPPRLGLYRWYRRPFDALERAGTARATVTMVNSRYTARVFARTYPTIATAPHVVYPGVDVDRWVPRPSPPASRTTIVSIARFERSKNVELAIAAFAALRRRLPPGAFAPLRLAIAGGFDERLRDAVDTLAALRHQARVCGLDDQIDFLPSLPEPDLRALVADALAVVYTPTHEHFGFVPVEAMASGRPVVAVAEGGPLETVEDAETGFLVAPTADAFAEALARLVVDPDLADRMGVAGRARVVSHFSRASFGAQLDALARHAVARAD